MGWTIYVLVSVLTGVILGAAFTSWRRQRRLRLTPPVVSEYQRATVRSLDTDEVLREGFVGILRIGNRVMIGAWYNTLDSPPEPITLPGRSELRIEGIVG